MKELSVCYCPVCGRYSYCQSREIHTAVCSNCDIPMAPLMPYAEFRNLDTQKRDLLLIQKIIAQEPSISSRILAYLRSCASGEAATLLDSRIHQLETENKKLHDTIAWMHQTIWDLLSKNKSLEHQLEDRL